MNRMPAIADSVNARSFANLSQWLLLLYAAFVSMLRLDCLFRCACDGDQPSVYSILRMVMSFTEDAGGRQIDTGSGRFAGYFNAHLTALHLRHLRGSARLRAALLIYHETAG